MQIIKTANLLIRFLLELGLLAIAAYWGFQLGPAMPLKIGLSLSLVLMVAVIWGIFLAPASTRRLPQPWLLGLELLIFGAAITGLYRAQHGTLALTFGLIYISNKILMMLWRQ